MCYASGSEHTEDRSRDPNSLVSVRSPLLLFPLLLSPCRRGRSPTGRSRRCRRLIRRRCPHSPQPIRPACRPESRPHPSHRRRPYPLPAPQRPAAFPAVPLLRHQSTLLRHQSAVFRHPLPARWRPRRRRWSPTPPRHRNRQYQTRYRRYHRPFRRHLIHRYNLPRHRHRRRRWRPRPNRRQQRQRPPQT
jgi:hypothetical protein